MDCFNQKTTFCSPNSPYSCSRREVVTNVVLPQFLIHLGPFSPKSYSCDTAMILKCNLLSIIYKMIPHIISPPGW